MRVLLKLQRLSHFTSRIYGILPIKFPTIAETNHNHSNYVHIYDSTDDYIVQLWRDFGFNENIEYVPVELIKVAGVDEAEVITAVNQETKEFEFFDIASNTYSNGSIITQYLTAHGEPAFKGTELEQELFYCHPIIHGIYFNNIIMDLMNVKLVPTDLIHLSKFVSDLMSSVTTYRLNFYQISNLYDKIDIKFKRKVATELMPVYNLFKFLTFSYIKIINISNFLVEPAKAIRDFIYDSPEKLNLRDFIGTAPKPAFINMNRLAIEAKRSNAEVLASLEMLREFILEFKVKEEELMNYFKNLPNVGIN